MLTTGSRYISSRLTSLESMREQREDEGDCYCIFYRALAFASAQKWAEMSGMRKLMLCGSVLYDIRTLSGGCFCYLGYE